MNISNPYIFIHKSIIPIWRCGNKEEDCMQES